jgi:hypothetical protein
VQNTVIFKTTTRNNEGFAEALGSINGDKGKENLRTETTLIAITIQSLLSPHSLLDFFWTKKGERKVFVQHVYGRFLSINKASTMATTMIKTNKPAIAGTKYMSATDTGCVDGVGVGADSKTVKAVSDCDGQ